MTDEEFRSYRDGRYATILNYYDTKAIWNKRLYYACSVYVLVGSGIIGPIVLLCKTYGQTLAAILSSSVAVIAAISGLFRFHESWLSFRSTWDALNHEIHWHDAKVGPYAGKEVPNRFFVEQVESLISREGAEWLRRHAHKEKADASGKN